MTVRIGGASRFWDDAARCTAQLLNVVDLDYLVYDYLAEIAPISSGIPTHRPQP
jgi:hypothetical protein